MIPQKLITLAAVLVILICGACAGSGHYTPPPPPPLETESIKKLRVLVVNQSHSNRLDSSALAEAIVVDVNRQTSAIKTIAHLRSNEETTDDATLEVTILSETAVPHSPPAENGLQEWAFAITVSASLTGRDGKSIWRGKEFTHAPNLSSYAHDAEAMWKDPIIQSQVLSALGRKLTTLVIYQPEQASAAANPIPPSVH